MSTTVVCVGMALIDLILELDDLPLSAGKHFAHGYREVGGGIAANGAVTVARLGGSGRLWSRVGDDPLGERIEQELRDYGVDTRDLQRVAGATSALSCVLVDAAGERLLVNYREPALFEPPPDLPFEQIAQADALLVDLRWPAAAQPALSAARAASVPALLDFDQSPDRHAAELLAQADYTVFGREALAQLSGSDDPQRGLLAVAASSLSPSSPLSSPQRARFAVTLGEQGVLWLDDRGRPRRLPAFAVRAVDTLAAGDVFHGALALALGERRSFADGLRFASAAAALKCTRPGGRLGIPDRAEVEQLLRRGLHH